LISVNFENSYLRIFKCLIIITKKLYTCTIYYNYYTLGVKNNIFLDLPEFEESISSASLRKFDISNVFMMFLVLVFWIIILVRNK